MKTNTYLSVLAAAVGTLLLAALIKINATYLPGPATAIGYLAVAGVVAVAAGDYRGSFKNLFPR